MEIPSPPNQQRWLPRWLSHFADLPRAIKPSRIFPPVRCSVECWAGSGSAPGETGGLGGEGDDDAAPENHVVIGGMEELLGFVRGSVLAGPRPVSPAFHQDSLRYVRLHRSPYREVVLRAAGDRLVPRSAQAVRWLSRCSISGHRSSGCFLEDKRGNVTRRRFSPQAWRRHCNRTSRRQRELHRCVISSAGL